MPHQAGDFLLNLDELPLRIQLEGCPGEVARSIAYQWFCPVHSRTADSGAFRVRFRVEPGLSFRPSASTRLRGQVRLRVQTLNSTSRLLLPGTRTTLTAGGSGAEIEVHPQVLHDPHLMEQATGGALGHALALASASFLHGAALIVDDLPILLLGGPQAGKSTVSAATLSTGGTVISDDSLILYR